MQGDDWVTVSPPRIATMDDLHALTDFLNGQPPSMSQYRRMRKLESDVIVLTICIVLLSIAFLGILKRVEALENA